MWEDILSELRELPVAAKPELGITEVLSAVQDAVDDTRVMRGDEAADKLAAALPKALRLLESTGVVAKYLSQAGDAVTAGLSLAHVVETVARKWADDGEAAAIAMAEGFVR